jgi:hypothetical protein
MNILEFKVALQAIKDMNYAYEFEAAVRQYTGMLNTWRTPDLSDQYTYRLASSALEGFYSRSKSELPEKLVNIITQVGKKIFNILYESVEPATTDYQHFMTIFEDTPALTTISTKGYAILNFSEVVKDSPINTLITFSHTPAGLFEYIGEKYVNANTMQVDIKRYPTIAKIIHLEHLLKHTKDPDKSKYVHLNNLISSAYAALKPSDIDRIPAIIYHSTDILDLIAIVKSKLQNPT